MKIEWKRVWERIFNVSEFHRMFFSSLNSLDLFSRENIYRKSNACEKSFCFVWLGVDLHASFVCSLCVVHMRIFSPFDDFRVWTFLCIFLDLFSETCAISCDVQWAVTEESHNSQLFFFFRLFFLCRHLISLVSLVFIFTFCFRSFTLYQPFIFNQIRLKFDRAFPIYTIFHVANAITHRHHRHIFESILLYFS